LHSPEGWVAPALLEALPPDQWQSLQLVRCSATRFVAAEKGWRVRFEDVAGNAYSPKLTDPVAIKRLSGGERIGPDCLLTISLGEPWAPEDGSLPARCYKLVAGVIELRSSGAEELRLAELRRSRS
jgi:hypothetical protein